MKKALEPIPPWGRFLVEAPEARHSLAQPVRTGLKGGRMASTGGAARWSRSGRKNKTPRPKPGRIFLQHEFYQDRTALVKENVSNGAE